MDKKELIKQCIRQLNSSSYQLFSIPRGLESKFWKWFEEKSILFESKDILHSNKKFDNPSFEILEGGCYPNSIIVNQEIGYDYFEGFYLRSNDELILHGFNVFDNKVNDITRIRYSDPDRYTAICYIGVKIDDGLITP